MTFCWKKTKTTDRQHVNVFSYCCWRRHKNYLSRCYCLIHDVIFITHAQTYFYRRRQYIFLTICRYLYDYNIKITFKLNSKFLSTKQPEYPPANVDLNSWGGRSVGLHLCGIHQFHCPTSTFVVHCSTFRVKLSTSSDDSSNNDYLVVGTLLC